jgi:S1-C subfamily serine protease
MGLSETVSDGIVSAVRGKNQKWIQISAPISPGSSGRPVLNLKGEVVGVATSQAKEGQNLNFAINSKYIESLVRRGR